jgi:hypothetical protein
MSFIEESILEPVNDALEEWTNRDRFDRVFLFTWRDAAGFDRGEDGPLSPLSVITVATLAIRVRDDLDFFYEGITRV